MRTRVKSKRELEMDAHEASCKIVHYKYKMCEKCCCWKKTREYCS